LKELTKNKWMDVIMGMNEGNEYRAKKWMCKVRRNNVEQIYDPTKPV
jgi:hypothetical protein